MKVKLNIIVFVLCFFVFLINVYAFCILIFFFLLIFKYLCQYQEYQNIFCLISFGFFCLLFFIILLVFILNRKEKWDVYFVVFCINLFSIFVLSLSFFLFFHKSFAIVVFSFNFKNNFLNLAYGLICYKYCSFFLFFSVIINIFIWIQL